MNTRSKFRIFVSDTITYERSQVVEIYADNLTEACEFAINEAIDGKLHDRWERVEIDNTPYEATEAEPVVMRRP